MSATLALFRKTAGHGDIKKSAQKVADTKKDTVTRLKHLRLVLDNYETQDAKKFFLENYSHIYYIFYDNFGTVEADLKQRANKAHREELEGIIFIFQKILFLLPEIVHKRWMFHSIGRIIKKLLHPGNSLQLRREGVRLFLVWYQTLQENASEECHQIFLNLVPGLGNTDHDLMSLMTDNSASDDIGGIIAAGEITAILPSQAEKIPNNLTKFFLDNLLNYMVSEVVQIEWMNKEMREQSFDFLFTKFKAKYLHWLLPDFVYRDIYSPVLEMPTARTKEMMNQKDEPLHVSECRDSFIFWLSNFTMSSHKPGRDLQKGLSCSVLADTAPSSEDTPIDHQRSEEDGDVSSPVQGSKGSTLSTDSTNANGDVTDTTNGDRHGITEYDIVRSVLYSSRENINILHECFRQALLMSFRHTHAIRKVIGVYKEWFQHKEERPLFMKEPLIGDYDADPGSSKSHETKGLNGEKSEFHRGSLSDIVEEDRSSFDDSPPASALSLLHPTVHADGEEGARQSSNLRSRSYLGAVQDLADKGEEKGKDVRLGLQKVLQVFIINSANIFLLDVDDDTWLKDQVELCKRVLNIYRHVVMNVELDQHTWEQMLKVLLCITSGVLKRSPPIERFRTLGGMLAQPIFQTMIVTWTKANLNVFVSASLWDEFLSVLSSLTSWKELILEWAKTMETLTRVLARQVYNLDLNDLPLERLSEQKEKRRRGKESTKGKPVAGKGGTVKLEKSFSRGWSANEGQPTNTLRSSTNSAPSPDISRSRPFERTPTYKSDGAGGKVRPDLSKQKSLSGEPSPAHSRCPSTSSECLVRSSSEGNLVADPHELLEKLRVSSSPSSPHQLSGSGVKEGRDSTPTSSKKGDCEGEISSHQIAACNTNGASATVMEDVEVSEITTTCTAELSSTVGPHSVIGEGSYEEGMYSNARESRTPSPSSVRSKSGSRSPSPSLMLISGEHHKDSPTPDRDSLHIDITGPDDSSVSRGLDVSVDSIDELRSIMAGGTLPGWTPDVAVVLWQRMLGCLGDVNKIDDPDIHATVFDALAELLDTLCRMSDNLGVTQDNMSSPAPPELIPPLHIFASWLFQCLLLSNKFKRGKLMAYQLICQSLLRRHEVIPSQELLSQFYLILHSGLVASDQDIVNVLVRDCGPKFFSLSLPGCLLLTLDFIKAAGSIISSVDYKEPPRAEAVTVLGSLLCFPHHLQEIPVLEHESMEISSIPSPQLKEAIIDLLLKAGKREPAGLARCVAVSSVCIFLYGELSHKTMHPKMKEAINVLLGALMCVNKKVAKVASDMLHLLCDHVDRLLDYHPQMPKKITEAIASTVSGLIPSHGATNSEEEKRLIVSMMFCMVEWCLRMPMPLLIETSESDKSCIYKVFRVLHSAVTGHSSSSLTRVSKSLSDFLLDTDFVNVWETQGGASTPQGILSSSQRPFSAEATLSDSVADHGKNPSPETGRKPETDIVKLAARALMTHLVNHMSHFPMGSGAARLHTIVQEHHDLPNYMEDDLKQDIFTAPNVQFFVLNHRCLISFIELPAMDAPGGGVTAGLMTARTVCRIVVRDLCGKYCWENSVLYSPPWCTKESSRHNAQTLLGLATGAELEPLLIEEECDLPKECLPTAHPKGQLPFFDDGTENGDILNDMLAYIGDTSSECLLRPGKPLNISASVPEDLIDSAEACLTLMVEEQEKMEKEHGKAHKADLNMVAPPEMPAESQDPVSPFQMCRLLLDQTGLLSWEKRCHFDLLKKSDKVLRELKNLDAQKCRETHKIAVIYIAQGQEDKNSILSNNAGSHGFENFVAGLGWEVDLETHQGFMGGLQQNKTTGTSAPYWADSTCEVIFHVSTRLQNSGNDWHIKMRHLGNDEVHIVWSEHSRDYRRGIIPTEFGDIVIIIYPLPSGLYRIQINRKPEIPFFGPLFDGAIVDELVLSGLVRATAVNASRLKRSHMPFYHAFYEERAKCLETIIQQHTEQTMFEDFAENVFAPVLPANAAIVDTSLPSESSSSSLNEILQNSADFTPAQLSPNTTRQRGKNQFPTVGMLITAIQVLPDASDSALDVQAANSENVLQRTARRLSMKSRRASASRVLSTSSHSSLNTNTSGAFLSPPSSPKAKHSRKNSGGGNNNNLNVNSASSSPSSGSENPKGKSGKSDSSPKTKKENKSRSESPKSKTNKHKSKDSL